MKLSENEIQERLDQLSEWSYNENAIHTSIEFENFKEAFSFMTRVAFEAEAQEHHPEWTNVYNRVEISLSTHDAGGITEKDFRLAKTIDQLLES
ncbi:MAG: 4a-hydroxytetrahydrobiopterin dehydratase [Flavobacteriaceae bacterium]|nr:4a-hydroxytetrahydrobiopterin dehydratase [Flavobacteriaceae bacterium]